MTGSKLPTLHSTNLASVASEPIVTEASGGPDTWTVIIGPVKATITFAEPGTKSFISVDGDLAESVDPQLAILAAAERDLDDDRWLARGLDDAVDDLYDRLHERAGTILTMIAAAVLPKLAPLLDSTVNMLRDLEYSLYAGCDSCRCSPGVRATRVRRWGYPVQIYLGFSG